MTSNNVNEYNYRPVRVSQLIRPFGVGAVREYPNAGSMITAGLDFWYSPTSPYQQATIEEFWRQTKRAQNPRQFRIQEERLQRLLNVEYFLVPPDWRPKRGDEQNEGLLEESILVCTSFLMDLITHMLFQHYDATWLFLNKKEFDLKNRLSKQREGEKQKIVEKYHNVSPEERMLLKNKQETGQTNQFKEASENYGKYVNSEEYALSTETQRSEKIQEIFAETLEYEDVEDMNDFQLPNIIPERELDEEEGYYDENDFDENNEEFMVGLDQEQDMNFNE